MKTIKSIWSYLVIALIFNSCASVIGSKYQTLRVQSQTEGSAISINDSTYQSIIVQKKVEKNTVFITNSKLEYLDETQVLVPYKRSPLTYSTLMLPVVYGFIHNKLIEPEDNMWDIALMGSLVGVAAWALDGGKKATLFENDIINFEPLIMLPKLEEIGYLLLDKVSITCPNDSIKQFKYMSMKRYNKGKAPLAIIPNILEFKKDTALFSKRLNNILADLGLTDTLQRLRKNSILLDCKLIKVKLKTIGSQFSFVDISAEWTLKNTFSQKKYSSVIDIPSKMFRIQRIHPTNPTFDTAFVDALKRSLVHFLNDANALSFLESRSKNN